MTRDDIIRMARDAGGGLESDYTNISALERFAALVAAAECEACAKVCDAEFWHATQRGGFCCRRGVLDCADAIRARKENT